jgi:hypothetical protein
MKRHIVGCQCSWREGSFTTNFIVQIECNQETNFSEYITERRGDKFARCSNCEKLKRLRDAHTMGTDSYVGHQLNYFKHVNMQEAHRNNYYTNRALSMSLECLMVIHDKMDYAKTASACFANRIKATDGFLKLFVLVTCEFGNNLIDVSKYCSVLLSIVIENMDSFKFIFLYIDNNPMELALQE